MIYKLPKRDTEKYGYGTGGKRMQNYSGWDKQERRKHPRDYKSYTCCPLCGHPISKSSVADTLEECHKCHAKIVIMVQNHIVVTFPSRRRQDYITEKQALVYFRRLAGVENTSYGFENNQTDFDRRYNEAP